MKRTFSILGFIFIGFGVLVLLGKGWAIILDPTRFSLAMNLIGMTVAGLLPVVIGVVLWVKSGNRIFGKVAYFFAGAAISWMTWTAANYSLYRPRDCTQAWTKCDQEIAPEWLHNAIGLKLGNYRLFVPADSSNASIIFQSMNDDGLPSIYNIDDNSDGVMDSILVADSDYCWFSVTDDNGDGVFDSYEFTTGIDPDSSSFHDYDMDGQYDFRLGPGRTMAVYIESQWRDVVRKENKHYVELKGTLRRVELRPPIRIVDDE